MKHAIQMISVAVIITVLASCHTTRKVAEAKEEHEITATVTTEQQSQSMTDDVFSSFLTETDNSTIVIEWVKTEYADGTTETKPTGAAAQNVTMQSSDREATEPPNVGKPVKSVTSGRATINNNKKRQENTNLHHSEATQNAEATSADMTQNDKSQAQIKEQPKSNLFWWGVAAGLLAVIGIALFLYHRKRKRNFVD